MFFLQKHGTPKSNGLSSVWTRPLGEFPHFSPRSLWTFREPLVEFMGSQAILLRPSGGYREVPRSWVLVQRLVDHWYPLGAETSQVPCFFFCHDVWICLKLFDHWNFGVSQQCPAIFLLSGNVSPGAYSWRSFNCDLTERQWGADNVDTWCRTAPSRPPRATSTFQDGRVFFDVEKMQS